MSGALSLVGAPTAVEPQNRWLELVAPAAELAKQISDTEFVPEAMRGKPAAVAACILFGAELGIGPMQALAKVDIVKGRPAPRAELARALALAAGHEVWIEEQTNTRVTVCGRRRGSENTQRVTWSMDDVKRAGISSHMYQKYPRQMLLARASAELVRSMCPDVLGGIGLFAEEAETEPVETSAPAPVEPQKATATTRKRSTPAQAALPAAAPSDDRPPLPGEEDDPSTVTDAQIKKMMAGFNDLGVKSREDRLLFIGVACRPIASSKDLTVDEASTVIDAIEQVVDGRLTLDWVDGVPTLTAPSDDGGEEPPLPGEEA